MKAQAGLLVMIRAADIAQLVLCRFFEPFDASSVEVRKHRKQFSTELLQTKNRIHVELRRNWNPLCVKAYDRRYGASPHERGRFGA